MENKENDAKPQEDGKQKKLTKEERIAARAQPKVC